MRGIRFVLVDAVEGLLVCLMVALCVDIAIGVYTRYVVGQTVSWYEEVARYLFIWMAFLGSAVAVRRRGHFVVHLVVDRLARGCRFAAELVCWGVVMGFSLFIFFQGAHVMEGVSVQTSPALDLNLSWVFLAVPVNGALSLLYAGEHFWKAIQEQRRGGSV
jgi:TRAP-type C4-dicarboxylate transport system permease small subunit